MTPIEMLKAALDQGCEIEIQTIDGKNDVCFSNYEIDAWAAESTLEKAIESAWSRYQGSKA